MIDFGGKSDLYYFSFSEEKYNHVMELSDKITYVNGNKDIIVLNYHSVDHPGILSGRIFLLNENEVVTIPHIFPVNEITRSILRDNLVYILSREYILSFNTDTLMYSALNLRSIQFGQISEIRLHEEKFGFLQFDNEHLVFSIINTLSTT